MPAPGTQHELLRKLEKPTLFFEGEPAPTVEEFSIPAARLRAERAAAAPPPIEPQRAYDGDGLGPVRDYMGAMAKVDDAMRQATEDAAYWRAGPSERLAMPDSVLDRNAAAVLAATRKAGSQPIRIAAAMDGRPGETAGPTAVQLPPGAYHEPLVPLMNRFLAVREGDDVGALRREVARRSTPAATRSAATGSTCTCPSWWSRASRTRTGPRSPRRWPITLKLTRRRWASFGKR